MTPEPKQQQINFIERTERVLGFNAKQMASALFVDYDTYGKWRRGANKLPAIAITALKMLVTMKVCHTAGRNPFGELRNEGGIVKTNNQR